LLLASLALLVVLPADHGVLAVALALVLAGVRLAVAGAARVLGRGIFGIRSGILRGVRLWRLGL
jgi:hypothetical protein